MVRANGWGCYALWAGTGVLLAGGYVVATVFGVAIGIVAAGIVGVRCRFWPEALGLVAGIGVISVGIGVVMIGDKTSASNSQIAGLISGGLVIGAMAIVVYGWLARRNVGPSRIP